MTIEEYVQTLSLIEAVYNVIDCQGYISARLPEPEDNISLPPK